MAIKGDRIAKQLQFAKTDFGWTTEGNQVWTAFWLHFLYHGISLIVVGEFMMSRGNGEEITSG